MTNKQKYKKLQPVWDAIEKLGWKVLTQYKDVDNERGIVEIETYSPAGENLVEYLELNHWRGENIAQQAAQLYLNFDTNEHVGLMMEAQRSGVPGVPDAITLAHDAEAIEKMYDELSDVIQDAYNKINEEV